MAELARLAGIHPACQLSPVLPATTSDPESLQVNGLTIENRTDRVAIYGSLHLTRDKAGLANAQFLKQLLEDVVEALTQDKTLPDKLALSNARRPASNLFS